MYKPIPFFMSNRGYGMFVHTSAPGHLRFRRLVSAIPTPCCWATTNWTCSCSSARPRTSSNEYTTLTGKAVRCRRLWSFGLWMSRITYFSEDETRARGRQAARRTASPSDVIHLDTGWFENDWRCDYKFSTTRFKDPAKMIADLKRDGFHISLWQLPYFVPKNSLFPEIRRQRAWPSRTAKAICPMKTPCWTSPTPPRCAWYQDKIAGLLKMGVGAIKVDFGEAAPLTGIYANGRSGFYEHNLYPLRYNKAVAEITRQVTGENIIWARSAWAGSQRYPLHWGGDSGSTGYRHGRDAARRPLAGIERLHLLEPRHRRLRGARRRRNSTAAGCRSAC